MRPRDRSNRVLGTHQCHDIAICQQTAIVHKCLSRSYTFTQLKQGSVLNLTYAQNEIHFGLDYENRRWVNPFQSRQFLRGLFEATREKIRTRHLAFRTEQAYLHWIRRYVKFHGRRHPRDMGAAEVERSALGAGSA